MQGFLAAAWTVLLYVGLAATAGWAIHRSPYTPAQSLLYFANVLLTRLLWRTSAPRRLPIGPDEGAVIIANHRSSVDPFFIQLSAGRLVHWMVATDFFGHPVIGRFLKFCESIPTRRTGVDTAATKAAIRYAQNGGVIGMFPEGRINRSGAFMMSVRPGAIVVAIKARVPIIPCYIDGSPFDGTAVGPLFMPARVRMTLGTPIYLDAYYDRENDKEAIAEATRHCIQAIARLAGREDFEPELAGRSWTQTVRPAS